MTDSFYFSTDDLTVGYNGKALISDITLGLKQGEILTLIGPNGSGKSTILKSITRHLAAIAGTVMIDGRNMRSLSGKETATKMAVVLTDRIRPELMTCGELVATGRYPYTNSFGSMTRHDHEVVLEALRRVHAEELYDRDFSELSDGQRQRIMLARAICQEPEIIVLDEPTSYLDIKHKIELLEILSDMAKSKGITVVMSLHEIDLAYKVSDKIVCVNGEKIAAYGTPEEIFSDESIRRLYHIERGSYQVLTGSVELAKPSGPPCCFAVGGGGYGIPFYRALQKKGISFAAGILFANDMDLPVASALAAQTVITAAFEPVSDLAITQAKKLLEAVDTVIDCGCPSGAFNRANLSLLTLAEETGKRIITSCNEIREGQL